jgi:HPt (histidine-containing phosphotransfer) domain-containing protein
MDEYVSKPLSPKALVQAIEALTAGRPAAAAVTSAATERLLARFDGDGTLLGELVAIFLEDYPARFAAVRAAVGQRDPAALDAAAHALRGSAANFGAEEAVEAAARLETMGRGRNLTGVEAAFDELERTMSILTGELAALAPDASQ